MYTTKNTMEVNGKAIAEKMLEGIKEQVTALGDTNIFPTLIILQFGDNPASLSYIKQKQKAAENIGVRVIFEHDSEKSLKSLIDKYNNDPSVHSLIVQRPLPDEMGDQSATLNTISPAKDVDGFVPRTPYEIPVAKAVIKILQYAKFDQLDKFDKWIQTQNIVVIGRGDTAGAPIAELLTDKYGCNPVVVHSQTKEPDTLIRSSDIVISCVGKKRVVHPGNIKHGSILISVGISRDDSGKLHGDYEADEIKDIASAYTPTPGGVGPVNVACLMENVVLAAQKTR